MTSSPRAEALLAEVRVGSTTKGFPSIAEPVPLLEAGSQGWTFADLVLPVLLLRAAALEHNVRLMAEYCRRHGVSIAPHAKTTMAPQLWWKQLEAGGWGMSAAGATQARVLRAASVRRVLLANEVTDPGSLRWVAADMAEEATELVCLVDSIRGVSLLEEGVRGDGGNRPLSVLVELGHPAGRTGCRSLAEAVDVARTVERSSLLDLAGVAGYEGTIAHDRSPASLGRVEAFLDDLGGLATHLLETGAFAREPIVTAGGSLFFDLVVERLAGAGFAPAILLLRSGSYVVHDAGPYARSSPFAGLPLERRFHPALEAWGAVLSTPEHGLALVGLGRRDVPFDQGYPTPLVVRRAGGEVEPVEGRVEVTSLDDQHAYCRVGRGFSLGVGDLVMCGISHPCSALDRWRVLPVLDEGDHVVDAVATFF
jgi:D-serine deaminase-like pyridoxal phosphate-dependent protein